MEVPKEGKKYSCRVCGKRFPSYHALNGHMNSHSGDKKKTKSTYGNEEPEGFTRKEKELALVLLDLKKKPVISKNEEPKDLILTLKSDVEDVALVLMDMKKKKPDCSKNEEREDLPRKSKVSLNVDLNEMPDFGDDELLENNIPQSKAEEVARKSLSLEMPPKDREKIQGTDQASDSTSSQDIESTAVVPRFNCDGYIMRSNVGWAKRRRS